MAAGGRPAPPQGPRARRPDGGPSPTCWAYMGFPADYLVKLHSTSPLERLKDEIKRRTAVVGIFPMRLPHPPRRRDPYWSRMTNGPSSGPATYPGKHRLGRR